SRAVIDQLSMGHEIRAREGDLSLQTPHVAFTFNNADDIIRYFPAFLLIIRVLHYLCALLQNWDFIRAYLVQQKRVEEHMRPQIFQSVGGGLRRFFGRTFDELVQRRNRQFEGLAIADHVEGTAAHDRQQSDDVQHVWILFQDIALDLLYVGDFALFGAA